MCLTEFDEKKYEDVLREEGREEGLAEGLEKGLAKGRKTEVFVSVQDHAEEVKGKALKEKLRNS